MSKLDISAELLAAPLGKSSDYISNYTPSLLFPIARKGKRDEVGIDSAALPFRGFDLWNGFELSWLNPKGKPVVVIALFIIPCESPNLIESKSFKLYLNSFNNSNFADANQVKNILENDLSKAAGLPVSVEIKLLRELDGERIESFKAESLDDLDIETSVYLTQTDFLTTESDELVEEFLCSDLLKSNCLVTGQPDWGSVRIHYKGCKISRSGLLKYLISFRNHNEFHEQCVERIFIDILTRCKPRYLTVEARYTRRGGLDINPIRSTEKLDTPKNIRMARQ